MSRESKTIFGGLTKKQVNSLSPEVREARAAYISDSGAQLDDLFDSGVTELRADHPDKDNWADMRRANGDVSLDQLAELGYQLDEQGNVYNPEWATD